MNFAADVLMWNDYVNPLLYGDVKVWGYYPKERGCDDGDVVRKRDYLPYATRVSW